MTIPMRDNMNREDMKTRMRRFEDETGVRGIKNAQLNLK